MTIYLSIYSLNRARMPISVSMGRWCSNNRAGFTIGTLIWPWVLPVSLTLCRAVPVFSVPTFSSRFTLALLWKRAHFRGFWDSGRPDRDRYFPLFHEIDHDMVAIICLCSDGMGLAQYLYQGCVRLVLRRRQPVGVHAVQATPKPSSSFGLGVWSLYADVRKKNVPLLHKPVFWAGVAARAVRDFTIVFW